MNNLIVTGAVSALSQVFSEILSDGCTSFAELEKRALELARRSAAEAMLLTSGEGWRIRGRGALQPSETCIE